MQAAHMHLTSNMVVGCFPEMPAVSSSAALEFVVKGEDGESGGSGSSVWLIREEAADASV